MTPSRRGLFGWFAALAVVPKAFAGTPKFSASEPWPGAWALTDAPCTLKRGVYVEEIDKVLKTAWSTFRIQPEIIYIAPDGLASIRAMEEVLGFDPLRIRFHLAKARHLRRIRAELADQSPGDDDDQEALDL